MGRLLRVVVHPEDGEVAIYDHASPVVSRLLGHGGASINSADREHLVPLPDGLYDLEVWVDAGSPGEVRHVCFVLLGHRPDPDAPPRTPPSQPVTFPTGPVLVAAGWLTAMLVVPVIVLLGIPADQGPDARMRAVILLGFVAVALVLVARSRRGGGS